ncbi:MATE family efflux transporter [Catenovulum sp. SM1970]|uniref:MATE family efflux transporter n=1 Tax=Marinifaba aquimaris TaxID=2741323 RepID=UPI001573F3AD|nr:MATE family efflux transporter [Marinifaba aquimaris]NTS78237.1 MATE family efflux transporter [Marinifaba aquimaris]
MMLIQQSKKIAKLAWPIVISQLALAGMITTDTIMSSQYSATDMAAIGTSLGIWHPISLFALGVIIALSPVLSRNFGAKDRTQFSHNISNGITLALSMSIIAALLMLVTPLVLNQLGIDEQMKTIAQDYLFYLALGLPGFCLFALFRVINESIGNTRTVMWVQISAFLLNIPLNLLFIFGLGDFEGLGGAGCGISTTLLHYMMFIMLIVMSYRHRICRPYLNKITILRTRLSTLKNLLQIGLPIGATMFFEVALFGGVALAIARFGPEYAAAHQIAISFSAIMYMLPLSLSMATTVVIGQHIGHQNKQLAVIAAKAGIIIGLSVATITALLTIIGREYISLIYTDDVIVSTMAMTILIWAAFFQFSDAVQCVALGALRGFKDTSKPMILTFIAYWFIGFPSGYLFAETTVFTSASMGLEGYWAGLLISLTSAAILLGYRLILVRRKFNQITVD